MKPFVILTLSSQWRFGSRERFGDQLRLLRHTMMFFIRSPLVQTCACCWTQSSDVAVVRIWFIDIHYNSGQDVCPWLCRTGQNNWFLGVLHPRQRFGLIQTYANMHQEDSANLLHPSAEHFRPIKILKACARECFHERTSFSFTLCVWPVKLAALIHGGSWLLW